MSLFSDLAPSEQQIDSFQAALKFAQKNPAIIDFLANDKISASIALTAQNLYHPADNSKTNYIGLLIISIIFIMIGFLTNKYFFK